jgi:hypothetical protein
MKELKFNKEYYMPILTGEKTQTLRKNRKRIRPGDIVRCVFPGTSMECKVKITKIGYKQFKYLNDEDAKLEGFESVDELKKVLMEIYPRLDKFDRLYYYRFKCLD